MSVVFFTNNSRLLQTFENIPQAITALPGAQPLMLVAPKLESGQRFIPVFFNTDASKVILAARNFIHMGWRLLHHPMYGNYRPTQQPYKSILMESPPEHAAESSKPPLDEKSVLLIEEAATAYAHSPALPPEQASPEMQEVCSTLDCDLMLLTLEQCGVTRRKHAH